MVSKQGISLIVLSRRGEHSRNPAAAASLWSGRHGQTVLKPWSLPQASLDPLAAVRGVGVVCHEQTNRTRDAGAADPLHLQPRQGPFVWPRRPHAPPPRVSLPTPSLVVRAAVDLEKRCRPGCADAPASARKPTTTDTTPAVTVGTAKSQMAMVEQALEWFGTYHRDSRAMQIALGISGWEQRPSASEREACCCAIWVRFVEKEKKVLTMLTQTGKKYVHLVVLLVR